MDLTADGKNAGPNGMAVKLFDCPATAGACAKLRISPIICALQRLFSPVLHSNAPVYASQFSSLCSPLILHHAHLVLETVIRNVLNPFRSG